MMTIHCTTNACIYENDGQCTLTHVTSVTNPIDKSCAYFKEKKKEEEN
ncbi:hypothetical protein [Alkaliphilus peptidifermentans]|uniref:DUF1540 domain-containing protein n=1 Tax=Alkaliphilus peptidifermentans DSM 18978 TaxID=1120976 RepID=A0A1G5L1T4_9FIRM|nr:hypothetical protein [Alkaliphilus peptidifermentans]SCZ06903.1 hypothetical protein SAMN03080606_03989 [Alkaliphilus peptidifermentans DSM 18978]